MQERRSHFFVAAADFTPFSLSDTPLIRSFKDYLSNPITSAILRSMTKRFF